MEDLNIGDAFGAGWRMYKENFGLCFGATLVALLIGGFSCGICYGPMFAGLFMILRRLVKKSEPKPVLGDVFKGFDVFLHSFLLFFICGIVMFVAQIVLMCIPLIGWMMLVVLCFAYGPMLFWALMMVAHRGMKWADAAGFVLKQTFNGKFLLPILLGIVAAFVGSSGAMLCGVGVLFTLPYSFCVYAAAYEQVFGSDAPQTEKPEVEVVA